MKYSFASTLLLLACSWYVSLAAPALGNMAVAGIAGGSALLGAGLASGFTYLGTSEHYREKIDEMKERGELGHGGGSTTNNGFGSAPPSPAAGNAGSAGNWNNSPAAGPGFAPGPNGPGVNGVGEGHGRYAH